jgi:hypothetical protein
MYSGIFNFIWRQRGKFSVCYSYCEVRAAEWVLQILYAFVVFII